MERVVREDRLLPEQRHERMLDELRRSGAVRVRQLARDLHVSELTVRRDIAALAARHLVTKVYGGATLPTRPPAARPRQTLAHFTIGMVVPSLDFYWPPIVAGARAAAAALGVNVQLRGSTYDPGEDRRQISRLLDEGQVQGLLLAPCPDGVEAEPTIEWIGHLPVPAILVERQPHRWLPLPRQVDWVRSDHALGLEMAAHHLYDQGHRRIALLLSRGSPTSAYLRAGWRSVCPDLGISDAETVHEFAEDDDRALQKLVRGLRRDGITALVVHSDPPAIAVARMCADAGLAVPGDMAIVSYDDEIAHLGEPALTAVRPPKNHVGRLAVELMVSRLLDGDRRPAQGTLVAPELIVRQSSVSTARTRTARATTARTTTARTRTARWDTARIGVNPAPVETSPVETGPVRTGQIKTAAAGRPSSPGRAATG
jgi:DNA-binding LacI/PurR family transcriptional regulator